MLLASTVIDIYLSRVQYLFCVDGFIFREFYCSIKTPTYQAHTPDTYITLYYPAGMEWLQLLGFLKKCSCWFKEVCLISTLKS